MRISSVGTLESSMVSRNRMAVQQTEARQSRGTGQEAAGREATGREATGREATGREATVQPTDVVSKNIQDEISEVQRQKQGLSSKQEMSEAERSKKKQELQQKLNSLSTRLRQRQAEVSRKQKQADRLEELSAPDTDKRTRRAEGKDEAKTAPGRNAGKNTRQSMDAEAPAAKDAAQKMTGTENMERNAGKTEHGSGKIEGSTGNTERGSMDVKHSAENNKDGKLKNPGIPQDKMQAIVGADIFREQTERREAVIARIEGGIAILKGEIRQDEMLGNDVQKKKAELKAHEAKVKNAANGLPAVNAPGRKSDNILRNAGREKAENEERAKARILKRSRDGVVVLKYDNGIPLK